jgi:hypothetical protein
MEIRCTDFDSCFHSIGIFWIIDLEKIVWTLQVD